MRMRTFWARKPPRPYSRSVAWGCLVANLFVLPGLGSITAGRKVGYLQAALALAGFGLSCYWVFWVVSRWVNTETMPDELGPYFKLCLAGIGLFILAWCWALASSIQILLAGSSSADLSTPPEAPPGNTASR